MNNIAALVGANSNQGPHRPGNEDAYWISEAQTPVEEYGALYIVADGVGGQEHGAAAAQQAVAVIRDVFYQERRSGQEVPAALEHAILKANQAVYEQAQARNSKMGCTVVAAVQHKNYLYIAHVGDARIYLLLENRLRRLTRDDTWVQKQVDAGIITAEEAEEHEWRNVVTQVLGNKLEITVHQGEPQALQPGNAFLLCSDGLHGVLSSEELYLILKNNTAQNAADKLVKAAIAADTQDNVTAVVVHATPPALAQAIAEPAPVTIPDIDQRTSLRPPTWVTVTVVTAVILLLLFTIIRLWPSSNSANAPVETVESETVPLVAETAVPASAVPTQIPPTATLPPTELPQVVPTAVPTDPPTPPPTLTPSPTPPQFACVSSPLLFVWQDAQVQTTTCDQFAQAGYSLLAGDQVRILDANPISVSGPDESCVKRDFIKIQSVERPEIEGWVVADDIGSQSADGTCSP
jgi:protein phosphatase